MCWDDDIQTPKSEIFLRVHKGNVCVEINRVDVGQDPSHRLLSCSNNVGQHGRKVLVLSSLAVLHPMEPLSHAVGPLLETQSVTNDQTLESLHQRHLEKDTEARDFPTGQRGGRSKKRQRGGRGPVARCHALCPRLCCHHSAAKRAVIDLKTGMVTLNKFL
jgi:hypothetical protein